MFALLVLVIVAFVIKHFLNNYDVRVDFLGLLMDLLIFSVLSYFNLAIGLVFALYKVYKLHKAYQLF